MDERSKMLKEKSVSRLRFEPDRAEALLMVKSRDIVSEPADSSEKDNSKGLSSGEKKYPILRTAVYRASRERKPKAAIKEEGICFGNVLTRTHKEGREESVCQPTSISEHETKKSRSSITKPTSLMSKIADNVRKTEMQTAVLEPSCHKKTREQPEVERPSKKPFRTKVYSYDRTEAIDDDAITHILRLRGKLGWQTNVQSSELLPREADVARFQKFTLTKPLVLEDSGEYIYCLQRNRNNFKAPYNPYDLQVVSVNTAMHSKIYWTVSASYVSKFSADPKLGQMEITAVPRWLHERQMYYKLRNVKFISNFKMKKYFLVWKISVRSKMDKTKSV
ncbi:dynein heavy chain 14, axonemal isoform X2 [Strigops habroptila]|nr:dynein heavy chain 14, axonemal isoform X2 [Strigops habroptila]